ncbi:gamma carbonic anhydrase family protein [Enterococcus casseliflavus]|uniref:gamma carbonic anhydrase family protein n=1 Tax=Enterococcus casseliflavus TaxID=37734 RepID=UPI001F4EE244|nr:gamma carbonic anhydrase family protein [Enterococcus casseliflavus]MDT2954907.1 gamma carbonic anhydrase family protein [Enterococcus casseliflavus]MDT2958176.1 gamma carbonic anhydrase family protein [Enterococcus casseliflavus]MDT2989794.1 gamma carbonic anhydrase family protein [Enterococcus casseliflavus]MDV7689458.1 gamma carbonic anhydrase family protein [Enterococcus casseliflavus]MDV7712715.1 gamma carbonic anhydrase family protein [Enterococcus casseliflavus]
MKKESTDPFMDWKEKLMDKEQSGNETHKTVSPASLQGTPCFVAKNATIVGNVTLGKESTVWFQAVIRGDANRIEIGARTNIQDGTIIHVDHDAPTIVEDDVTVGHQCMLHGCTIKKGALIGMSSIVLNHAVIGENSLLGAGSLVTEGTVIPPNVLAFGRPARVIRPLTEEEIAKNQANITHYVENGYAYQQGEYGEV